MSYNLLSRSSSGKESIPHSSKGKNLVAPAFQPVPAQAKACGYQHAFF
jgi:hypothetical protein